MEGNHYREVPGELVACSRLVNQSVMTMESAKEIAAQVKEPRHRTHD